MIDTINSKVFEKINHITDIFDSSEVTERHVTRLLMTNK